MYENNNGCSGNTCYFMKHAWVWLAGVYKLPCVCEHTLPFLQAVEKACEEFEIRSIQGWIRYTSGIFPVAEPCVCDVDEILWLDPYRKQAS